MLNELKFSEVQYSVSLELCLGLLTYYFQFFRGRIKSTVHEIGRVIYFGPLARPDDNLDRAHGSHAQRYTLFCYLNDFMSEN